MQNRVVLFLVVIAVIIAIAFFLLISFLTRPAGPQTPAEQPAGDGQTQPPAGQTYLIGDTQVIINVDPARRVHIAAPEGQQPAPTVAPPAAPTETATAPPPTATVAPAPAAAGPVAGAEPIIIVDYVVQPGDTLYRITQNRQTSIELMAEYNIASGNIQAGKTIRIPVANPNYCAASQAYLVRPNETVFSIARRHGTTKEAIAQLNSLGPDYRIDINRVLCIP